MATYVNDLRLKEIGTGESSGTWGTETNVNLELIGEALGFGTEAITTNADTHTTTVADGSTDPGRAMYIKYTGTLDSACTITIGPNTMSRLHYIENATSGSQNIIISQGSGANITIPAGDTKAVYLDGAGSGAAVVDVFASFSAVDLKVQDDLTVTDDATIGGTLGVTGILTCTDDIIIGDGKTIGSASDVDAITIASNGQVTFTQTLIGTALDISGDIDVDGTSNLDVVDIDGAVDMATTLTLAGNADFNGDLDVDGTTNLDVVDVDGAVDMASSLTMSGGSGGDIIIVDNGKLEIGSASGGDLQLYHDASDSYVNNQGTGHLKIRGNDVRIEDSSSGHSMGLFIEDGGVELYHNNVKKFEVTSTGIDVTGTVTQSTTKTAQFTGQYDGRETTTITLGSLGFKPQVLFSIFTVGTSQHASWGMAARDGGHQVLLDYDAQAAADGYEASTSYFGRLAFGSAVFSNLAVSSWAADEVVIQKSVDNSGSSSTCVYKIIVMG